MSSINERNEWAQKADDVSSVIKGATVASSLSLTFPLCELYTNYLEKRLEKIEDKDRITLLQAFANQAKGKGKFMPTTPRSRNSGAHRAGTNENHRGEIRASKL